MATIKEIAKRANVSTATVSHVINGSPRVSMKTRRRVEAVIKELDYEPSHVARSLKLRKTHLLGLIIADITNPFYPLLVRGVEDGALESGYLVITFNSDDHLDREAKILEVLRSRRVDGILLVPTSASADTNHVARTMEAGIPLVCLDRLLPQLRLDSVAVSNAAGARECVAHLLSLGHRRIGVISGRRGESIVAAERLRGYSDALQSAGIPLAPELIREGEFRSESGYVLCRELMESNHRPTALFLANNTVALGALTALRDMKIRCPEDIAVAVFDDLPYMSALVPSLTAVSQPAYDIGYQGVRLLLRRVEGQERASGPISILLQTELRIRESTTGEGYQKAISAAASLALSPDRQK